MSVNLDSIHANLRRPAKIVRFLASDVDGTLLAPDALLDDSTRMAAKEVLGAGIDICLLSSRPIPGVLPFVSALSLSTPFAALNGAMISSAQGEILAEIVLDDEAVAAACDMLHVHGADAWLYRGKDWIVTDLGAPFVHHEMGVVKMDPIVTPRLRPFYARVNKITGASNDKALLQRLEVEIGAMLEGRASVVRSSDHYLDITPIDANKGYALRMLARMLDRDLIETAAIGDMPNDLPMLKVAHLSIAMGNANDEVRAWAHETTTANDARGWANAVENYILPRAPRGVN